MRPLKFIIGILLLPACVAGSLTLWDLFTNVSGGSVRGLPIGTWSLLGGFFLWLLLYGVAPRPMRSYILAHELTHALWGTLMGARIVGMKVGKDSGYVKLTRINFLISLAPYFFPFYTVCIILLHTVLSFFFDLRPYAPVWLAWIGLTWGFHLTFTLATLRIKQPDVQAHGRLFSYAIIYLFNLLGICIWIVAVTDIRWHAWSLSLWDHIWDVYSYVGYGMIQGWAHAGEWIRDLAQSRA